MAAERVLVTSHPDPQYVANPQASDAAAYPTRLRRWINLEKFEDAWTEIRGGPDYAPTPLVSLPGLARHCSVGAILYKDESKRFDLKSFKALGGAYAVLRLLQSRVQAEAGRGPSSDELRTGRFSSFTRKSTVCSATDGNHGRAVAWGARMFGCQAVIYVHELVSQARIDAMKALGATVVVSQGTYDDTVTRLAQDAAHNDWSVVSDTSYDGYVDVPCDVMQGYTVFVEEALREIPESELPTHVFVQAGAGALAGAVCAHLWQRLGARRPQFVVVQSDQSAGLFTSIVNDSLTGFAGKLDTIMGGLAVGMPSLIGWDILRVGLDAVMTISDIDAIEGMRILRDAPFGDPRLVAGESGAAGLAGVLVSAKIPGFFEAVGLNETSRILVLGTEGATDPESYRKLVLDR
jgi:diaminopropionate ammonia-lyase